MKINGTEYDLVIDGSDIIANGLTKDIVFKGGADLLNSEAEDAYYSTKRSLGREDWHKFNAYPQDVWIAEYVDECIEEWVKRNMHLGCEVDLNLN